MSLRTPDPTIFLLISRFFIRQLSFILTALNSPLFCPLDSLFLCSFLLILAPHLEYHSAVNGDNNDEDGGEDSAFFFIMVIIDIIIMFFINLVIISSSFM